MNNKNSKQMINEIVRSFFPGDEEGEELATISKTTLTDLVERGLEAGIEIGAGAGVGTDPEPEVIYPIPLDSLERADPEEPGEVEYPCSFEELKRAKMRRNGQHE